jgi:hypothetical protein
MEAGMVVEAISSVTLPWGAPSYMACLGHDPDGAVRRPRLDIGYEWPINWLRALEPLDDLALEWLHIQRFRTDHAIATGSHAFTQVGEGSDPPDAVVDIAGTKVGLECTRLTIPERLGVHGLFRTVRQRLATFDPENFAALAGHFVYMWFNDADSVLVRPYRKTDEQEALELIQALASYQPEPVAMWVPDGAVPEQAPELPMHRTDAGASFYSIPFAFSCPDTVLFSYAGFELGCAYTTHHHADDELHRISAMIDKKDRPENDWLLISVGAPDKLGYIYPAEEPLAEFVLQHGVVDVSPRHLERVIMHFWSTGRAVELWPQRRELFGPLYTGVAVGSRPIPSAGP